MDTIASNALGRLYRDGEIIMRQGEMGDCMYLILGGKAEVLQRKDEQEYSLAVLEKGDCFGEMGLFDHDVRSATVRALGGAILLTVDKRMFMQRIHEDASFAYRILRRMARRIRELEALLVSVADTNTVQTPIPHAELGQPPGPWSSFPSASVYRWLNEVPWRSAREGTGLHPRAGTAEAR